MGGVAVLFVTSGLVTDCTEIVIPLASMCMLPVSFNFRPLLEES